MLALLYSSVNCTQHKYQLHTTQVSIAHNTLYDANVAVLASGFTAGLVLTEIAGRCGCKCGSSVAVVAKFVCSGKKHSGRLCLLACSLSVCSLALSLTRSFSFPS